MKSRAGAAKLGAPLMVLCVLGIAGFLYWLSVTAESGEIAVEAAAEEEAMLVNLVDFAEFSVATASYVGQEISLEGIPVSDLLGPHSFWTNLADVQNTPYLLHLSDSLLADSVALVEGGVVTVTGTVNLMSDSVLNAWDSAGAFPQSSDRFLAEFAENFIEATMVDTGEEPAAEGGAAPDDGDPSDPAS